MRAPTSNASGDDREAARVIEVAGAEVNALVVLKVRARFFIERAFGRVVGDLLDVPFVAVLPV